MERITRTCFVSTVYSAIVEYTPKSGATLTQLEPFTMEGKVTEKRALIEARKRLKTRTANIVITDIAYEGHKFSMDVQDFVKLAERID